MNKINCGGFYINESTLKILDNALTKQETQSVSNIAIAGCGGLLIDSDIFKFDKKTHSITLKEAESVNEVISAPCGELKLDTVYFELDENGFVKLKEVVQVDMLAKSDTSTQSLATVIFESLDDFTIVVKDENDNIVEPIEDKIYQIEKTKQYSYEAINSSDKKISGTITATSGQSNITKTIEF